MVSGLIGVVNDTHGGMVSVEASGPQVVIGFAVDQYHVFDPSQIAELISHLETAHAEALINETGTNCPDCLHVWARHGTAGCTCKVYPSWSLDGEPCPCERGPFDE